MRHRLFAKSTPGCRDSVKHCFLQISVNINKWLLLLKRRGSFTNTYYLTHWDRAKHICVGKLTIIDSDNGLAPGRRQAIILTYDGILLIGPTEMNVSEIVNERQKF